MNGDHVGGIAVLDKTREPSQLWILCLRTNKNAFPINLPVALIQTPQTWGYRIDGDIIHVQPSVLSRFQVDGNWIERFHNNASWSVPFKEAKPDGREDFAYQQFRESPENKSELDKFYTSDGFE